MGRMYTASGDIAAFATAGDIIEINASSNEVVKLYSVEVSQSTTEVDDSTEIRISRFATSGTGGGTPVASPSEVGDAAFGGTLEEASTVDASGTETILISRGISLLAGFSKIWLPEIRPVISPSARIVVKTIGDITSVTLHWELEFEEIGG